MGSEMCIRDRSDLVNILREEILAVIAKHVSIDPEKVKVSMDRGDAISMLEVDIELPIAEPVMDREVRTAHG